MRQNAKQRGPIDWNAVRDRLAKAIAATDGALTLAPERARRILDDRARKLARVPPRPDPSAARMEAIAFVSHGERYALETRYVRAIGRIPFITRLPGAPEHVAGIAPWRGAILPVLDLSALLQVPATPGSDRSKVVVMGAGQPEFGLIADELLEIADLRIDELAEPPDQFAAVGRDFVRGIGPDATIVLDGAALLDHPRLFFSAQEISGR